MKITRRWRIRANTAVLEPYMTGDAVDLKQGEQEFSSKDTAVNGKQGSTPAVFKAVRDKIGWKSGTINLDYGGGTVESDAVADTFFEPLGVTNVVYDKFNQTSEHNQAVIRFLRSKGGADTATLSNVLNVIKEIHIRREVLEDVYSMLKPNGVLYAYVHQGTKDDRAKGARQTSKGWQNFRETADYLDEIHEVFPAAYVKYGVLICPKTTSMAASRRVRGRSIAAGRTLIDRWIEDLQETGFGYDNPSDFDNEAELNDAMSAEVRWYEQQVPKKYTGNLPEIGEEDMYDQDEDDLIFV